MGNLIASLDVMLRDKSWRRPAAETAETSNFDEFNGKDCVFVADWLKTKGLHKLCSVFEGV